MLIFIFIAINMNIRNFFISKLTSVCILFLQKMFFFSFSFFVILLKILFLRFLKVVVFCVVFVPKYPFISLFTEVLCLKKVGFVGCLTPYRKTNNVSCPIFLAFFKYFFRIEKAQAPLSYVRLRDSSILL